MTGPEETREKGGFDTRRVLEAICDRVRERRRQMEDAMLSILPSEVTGHLLAAKKEMVRAGILLGELAVEDLDRKTARARELAELRRQKREV